MPQPDEDFRCPVCGVWCFTPSMAAEHCNNGDGDGGQG